MTILVREMFIWLWNW